MRFEPSKTKYKKQQKGCLKNRGFNVCLLNKLNFGVIGLKACSFGRITSKQLEAFRFVVTKVIKKCGKVNINLVADIPVSKKPLEVRMGKGKGAVNHWVCKVNVGSLICSIQTSSIPLAFIALKAGQYRFPLKTKVIFN